MVDARPRVMADVQLRATVVVIRRQVAIVADLRTAAVGHTVVDRTAVDMGGKASLDSCPSVAT